jgi:type III pantothenate kinase
MLDDPLVAVDVGNQRLKLGLFDAGSNRSLPSPIRVATADAQSGFSHLPFWLSPVELQNARWWIGSVQRGAATELLDWLHGARVQHRFLLTSRDLPLKVNVPNPDRVGIDRLLDAVAANVLRPAGRPAIIVDQGTAITVDLVDAEGAFRGGAILAGRQTTARALHEFTDLLPLIDADEVDRPSPLGTSTVEAMRAGLYWGTVGAVRELMKEIASLSEAPPVVYVTGGGGEPLARGLGGEAEYVPHLTLGGIALAAEFVTRDS